jgi:hypothetical protein
MPLEADPQILHIGVCGSVGADDGFPVEGTYARRKTHGAVDSHGHGLMDGKISAPADAAFAVAQVKTKIDHRCFSLLKMFITLVTKISFTP